MRRAVTLLLGLVPACNQVFGIDNTGLVALDADQRPDFDNDGVADELDPCIAAPIDATGDFDIDQVLNGDDACPLDNVQASADGDNVPDACDPFPALAGDHYRCLMTFRDPTLNAKLWQPRPGDLQWGIASGLTAPTNGTSTLLATQPVEAPTTTSYELLGHVGFEIPAPGSTSVRLLVRTSDTAATTDAGCELSGGSSSTQLAVIGDGATATRSVAVPFRGATFFLHATFEPNAATAQPNLRCAALVSNGVTGTPITAIAEHVPFAPGRVAFSVNPGNQSASLTFDFDALVIYDRDDAPTLP